METTVVLRFRDGHTERATLGEIDATTDTVAVRGDDGEGRVALDDLKAIFFVRSAPEESLEPPAGSRIAVEFQDGEVIRGIANLNPERHGFFLFPDDRSKNDRIFVVSSAINSIEVEKL